MSKPSGVQISTRGYAGRGPDGSNPEWSEWRDVGADEVISCLASGQSGIAEIKVRMKPKFVRMLHDAAFEQDRARRYASMSPEELLAPIGRVPRD